MLSIKELTLDDIDQLLDYWYSLSEYQLKIMGADISKMPARSTFKSNLEKQCHQHYNKKKNFACIWLYDGLPIGHNNINNIEFGNKAYMHLHIWDSNNRKSGLGYELLQLSIPLFFEKFELKQLICEPFAQNTAPNKVLNKLGFQFVKTYITIPGTINFKQQVNQWILTKEGMKSKNEGMKKIYVIMGVSGSGKSTIGHKISEYFGFPFFDGDDFHPETNIKKMSSGLQLNDDDREPWLKAINQHMVRQNNTTIYACSALKKKYRIALSKNLEHIKFIYLKGDFDLIYARVGQRKDHFMPPELLQSQFNNLEEPSNAITVDISMPLDHILNDLKKELK